MKKKVFIFFVIIMCFPVIAISADLSLQYSSGSRPTDLEAVKDKRSSPLEHTLLVAADNVDEGYSYESATTGPSRDQELSWDIIGEKGKYFHLAVSLTSVYTDNAYNSRDNKESDLSIYLSPEVWLTVPRTGKRPQDIRSTSSRRPGGMAFSRPVPVITRRYTAHLMYRADIPVYYVNSPSGGTVSQRFGGGVTYKGNRFNLDIIDRYSIGYEDRGTGISTEPSDVDLYNSNFFQTIFTYDTRHRFRLRFDYSNYFVDYDAARNAFRNRNDNAYSAYVFYKLRPKTAVFVQYKLISVRFDDNSTNDSNEHNVYGGISWDATAKTRGIFKAGYGIKTFENTNDDASNFILEAHVQYAFSPKSSFRLMAFRRTGETDVQLARYIISNAIEGQYQHLLTSKVSTLARVSYVNDEYKDGFTIAGTTYSRDDSTVQASLALKYVFRRWLNGSFGYIFETRNSSINVYDYSTNTVFLRITGAI